MISPARKLSYKLLRQIEAGGVFSDDALNSKGMEALDVRDRHLTTEIVYGSLRWQGVLDYLLQKASSRPWYEVDARARILLRMSVYQMWQMDRIPDHALVNDAVEIAKKELGRGIDRYINGILRNISRARPWMKRDFLKGSPEWVRVSLPQWLWERWAARYGEAAAAEYAISLNQPPRAAIRLNGAAPESIPFEVVRSDLVPDAALRLSGGSSEQNRNFHFQDEGSQLIPHLLGNIEGWCVWDSCAAPGGKSSILRSQCGNSGILIAGDYRIERAIRVAEMLRISGESRPAVLVADASMPAPFLKKFDAVLCDVPCSGLGTLRRNPEIKWRLMPEEHLLTFQRRQKAILKSVSDSVREGGLLLYSTCSTEPEENERVIECFLSEHPEFSIRRPSSPPGIESWIAEDGMVRTFPSGRLWDGFFAALLLKIR